MNTRKIDRNMVASLAGVSSATVSRVYNAPSTVSKEKRRRVFEAAEELGYRPNKSASSLRRRGTGTILLLECVKPERSYYWKNLKAFNWFYADVIHGLGTAFDASMFTLKLMRLQRLDDITSAAREADGIIGFDIDREEEAQAAASLGIPYVISHHTFGYHRFHRCSTDNKKGGALQARYLHGQGCSRVLYLTGYLDTVYPHKRRLEGFLDEARCLGLHIEVEEHALEGSVPLKDIGNSYDGIAAVNDLTMLRNLQGVSPSDFRDVKLVGYDAMPVRDLLYRSFASVDPLPHEIYRRSGAMILSMLSGEGEYGEILNQVVEPVLSP